MFNHILPVDLDERLQDGRFTTGTFDFKGH
jgi:hypothetical protein